MCKGRKARGGLLFPAFLRALVRVVSSCSVSGDAQRRQIDVDDTACDRCCSAGVTGIPSLRSLSAHYSKPCGSRTATGPSSRKPRRQSKTNWRRHGSRGQAASPLRGLPSTLLHVPPRSSTRVGARGGAVVHEQLQKNPSAEDSEAASVLLRTYCVLGGVPRVRCGFVGGAERSIPGKLPLVVEVRKWNTPVPGRRTGRHELINLLNLLSRGLGLHLRHAPRACRVCTPEPSLLGVAHPTKPSCYRCRRRQEQATPRFEVGDTSLGKSSRREIPTRARATFHSPALARSAVSERYPLLESSRKACRWA
jgi:hypothetical protein